MFKYLIVGFLDVVLCVIVGIGRHHKSILVPLRNYFRDNPQVYVYPKFFDCKLGLLSGNYRSYLKSLLRRRTEISIALWLDYVYNQNILDYFNDIRIIFPLHRRDELDFILKLDAAEFLGYPSGSFMRDYGLSWFLDVSKEYGFKAWLLGLKPKYIKYIKLFDGADVTPMSCPGLGFKDFRKKEFISQYIKFIESLTTNK